MERITFMGYWDVKILTDNKYLLIFCPKMKSKINHFKEFSKNEIINKLGGNEFELISIP